MVNAYELVSRAARAFESALRSKRKTVTDFDCRIAPRVKKDARDCWVWQGTIEKGGYGRVTIRGRIWKVHRYVYTLRKGEIPLGLTLDHLCRNRACCNPDHLEAVTNRVNILRGVGATAMAAKKTHCPQGHPYVGENLYVFTFKRGNSVSQGRACRICQKAVHDRQYAKRKALRNQERAS